jgi:hypothetical protein
MLFAYDNILISVNRIIGIEMFNIQYSGHTVLCKPNETL